MNEFPPGTFQRITKPLIIATAVAFAYWSVIVKLGIDWWSDENYSHGLLIPIVVGFIVWNEREKLDSSPVSPRPWIGSTIISLSLLLLAAGTLGAELFTQRVSLVLMLAGVVVYFFGERILRLLSVSFVLILLAIPIPQIVFNRIAFPLQIWASQMAVWGIRLFEVPTVRNGNVIDILPRGSTQTISLEVVEACSGIRSLSTLITLALILGYVTRRGENDRLPASFSRSDFLRTIILMLAAVPIAVLTNAGRVTATGLFTYLVGKQASEGTVHEVSGWLVYVAALALLIASNLVLQRIFRDKAGNETVAGDNRPRMGRVPAWPIVAVLVGGGIGLSWFAARGEVITPRTDLTAFPQMLDDWRQTGNDFKFDKDLESVLGATDYTMREYVSAEGRIANLYVGYYASQRTGATYHSPQNCLPGAGWVLRDPKLVDITTSDGRTFKANHYIIENGIYTEVMIYWYEGRGRTEASEYFDKINTVVDSVTRRRTDGAMVRVMTAVGSDEPAATKAAIDLAARLEERLTPFVPK